MGVVTFVAIALGSTFAQEDIKDLPFAVRLGLVAVFLLSAVLAWSPLYIGFLFPTLELVPSSGEAAGRSVWRRALPFAAWVAGIVATAAATVFIDHVFF